MDGLFCKIYWKVAKYSSYKYCKIFAGLFSEGIIEQDFPYVVMLQDHCTYSVF